MGLILLERARPEDLEVIEPIAACRARDALGGEYEQVGALACAGSQAARVVAEMSTKLCTVERSER